MLSHFDETLMNGQNIYAVGRVVSDLRDYKYWQILTKRND
jgi:hypothetical protein